jgi:hypothetical protein
VAGIVATAVVGVAGSGTSWLVARDDRNSQRALQHDSRVFDSRAKAYVDAIVELERLEASLASKKIVNALEHNHLRVASRLFPRQTTLQATLAPISARIIAFGSNDARRDYRGATIDALSISAFLSPGPAGLTPDSSSGRMILGFAGELQHDVSRFEAVVRHDLA